MLHTLRLMCLHLVNLWYNTFLTVYRKRKFISKEHKACVNCCTVIIFTCILFGPIYAKTHPQDQLEFSKQDSEGGIPKNYKLKLDPLQTMDHCEDTSYFDLDVANTTNISFDVKQVHPDCPYELTIIPNPGLTNVEVKVNYTVPDCFENICSCKQRHQLPKPELKFISLNCDYEILLTITADNKWLSTNQLSLVKYRFVNSGNGNDSYTNQTISNKNANKVTKMAFVKHKLVYGSSYDLISTIIDHRQCEVAATRLTFITSAKPTLPGGALVKNLQIFPYYSEDNKVIELNVTWDKVSADWCPERYGFKITSLSTEGHCTEATDYEVFNISKAATTAIINQTKIVPGCSYTMELMPQPHNSDIGPHINMTISDCVGKLCSCTEDHMLIEPKIINIKSSLKRIEIKYKIIAEPVWLLGNNLTYVTFHFFNGFKMQSFKKFLTNVDANKHLNFTINITGLLSPRNYDFKLIVNNNRNCAVTSRIVHFKLPLSPKQQPLHWVFTVMIPSMFILMFFAILIIFMKQRKCCWILRKLCFLNNQCPAQTHVRRIYRPTNPDGHRGRPYLSVPMEYNNLYIEKEILDEMERGKADKYEISYSRLKFEHKIGGGAFGQVFLAKATAISGAPGYSAVAVKTLKKTATSEELEEFLLEIAMLKQIGRHPNIVRLLGCCTIKHPYCMIMEYIPCGDLSRYLRALRDQFEKRGKTFVFTMHNSLNSTVSQESQKISESSYIQPENLASIRLPSITETEYTLLSSEGAPLTPNTPRPCTLSILECELDPKELQNFALQIAKGMEYLESKQIVHRDLAARNVLIDENKVLKISDFGLSRSGIYVNTKHKTVPLRWLSVEAIRDNLYTSKSDVWAYAIVLWEIGTLGAFPYPAIANHELLGFLLKGKRLEKPENCTEELYNLMLKCWAHSGDERPSFNELVRYLESISNRKRVYVDFSQLNPSYMFPPTEEQSVTLMRTENNVKTIEIILTDK